MRIDTKALGLAVLVACSPAVLAGCGNHHERADQAANRAEQAADRAEAAANRVESAASRAEAAADRAERVFQRGTMK